MIRFLLLLLLLLPGLALGGGTTYRGEGTLWQDTVWDGEILIDGILTVAPGVTLEIRPGTTIRFTPFDSNADGIGEHEIFIQGRLRALGSAQEPILFTSAATTPRPGDWGAINLMASEEGNRLEHVRVAYAYRGFHAHFAAAELRDCELSRCVRGAQFQESTVALTRCRLLDNRNGLQFRDATLLIDDLVVTGGYWGVRGVQSRVHWRGGRIERNLVNGVNLRDCDLDMIGVRIAANRKGLYLQRSRGTVAETLLQENGEHGIFLEESAVAVSGCSLVGNGRSGIRVVAATGALRHNRFAGNGEYALVNDGPSPVDALANWWGSAEPGRIATLIRDSADRPGVATVDSGDFLPAPP